MIPAASASLTKQRTAESLAFQVLRSAIQFIPRFFKSLTAARRIDAGIAFSAISASFSVIVVATGNDANAIAAALNACGWAVTTPVNVNLAQMKRALRAFRDDTLDDGDDAVFYFSGHGFPRVVRAPEA